MITECPYETRLPTSAVLSLEKDINFCPIYSHSPDPSLLLNLTAMVGYKGFFFPLWAQNSSSDSGLDISEPHLDRFLGPQIFFPSSGYKKACEVLEVFLL